MFCNCSSLSSLPDISKWNTYKLEQNNDMFKGCDKILEKPIIKIKENTSKDSDDDDDDSFRNSSDDSD